MVVRNCVMMVLLFTVPTVTVIPSYSAGRYGRGDLFRDGFYGWNIDGLEEFQHKLMSMIPMAFITILLLMVIVFYFYCKLVTEMEPEQQLDGTVNKGQLLNS